MCCFSPVAEASGRGEGKLRSSLEAVTSDRKREDSKAKCSRRGKGSQNHEARYGPWRSVLDDGTGADEESRRRDFDGQSDSDREAR